MERLRLGKAAARLGVHRNTLRKWADEGKIRYIFFQDERRFLISDIDAFMGVKTPVVESKVVRAVLYVRVSGSTGQETGLLAQEEQLCAFADASDINYEIVDVFKDRASGLNEKRVGLTKLLKNADDTLFDVVLVTHPDRLSRFGFTYLEQLLEKSSVSIKVLHPKASSGMEELLEDFTSLIATFAGRMYGMRSKAAKEQLLKAATKEVVTCVERAGVEQAGVQVGTDTKAGTGHDGSDVDVKLGVESTGLGDQK